MEMKNNKGIIILVIILSLLVIGFGGYIVYDKILKNAEIEENNNNSNINKDKSFVFEETFTHVLNGSSQNIKFKYYNQEYTNNDEVCRWDNGTICQYWVRVSVEVNGKKIPFGGENNLNSNLNLYKIINTSSNNKLTNAQIETQLKAISERREHKLFTLNGSGKEYLVIVINSQKTGGYLNEDETWLLILNENGELLKEIGKLEVDVYNLINETRNKPFIVNGKNVQYYIDNDKLYYFGHTWDEEQFQENNTIITLSVDNNQVKTSEEIIKWDEYTTFGKPNDNPDLFNPDLQTR